MTIQVYDPVSCGCSSVHVWTNAKSCNDESIVLIDGTRYQKRVCAKVKLLSLTDFDGRTFDEYELFCKSVGAEKRNFVPMSKSEFFALDLMTHI